MIHRTPGRYLVPGRHIIQRDWPCLLASWQQRFDLPRWPGCGSFVLRAVLLIASLNTAISLYYYLRVVKVLTDPPGKRTADRDAGDFNRVHRGGHAASVVIFRNLVG